MKLSNQTRAVLNNFQHFNINLLLQPGNSLMTLTENKTAIAMASDLPDEFPVEFGIYDVASLNKLLSVFSDPDVDFTSKCMTISEGKNVLSFYAAPANLITLPKIKDHAESYTKFTITSANWQQLVKAAALLSAPDLSFVGDGQTISVVVTDRAIKTYNKYSIDIGETDKVFECHIKRDRINLLPGDYDISLTPKSTKFTNKSVDFKLVYFVANERDGVFNE